MRDSRKNVSISLIVVKELPCFQGSYMIRRLHIRDSPMVLSKLQL